MKKIAFLFLFLFLILIIFVLNSCSIERNAVYLSTMVEFKIPAGASVSVRDIRVKGFTLDWTVVPEDNYEYAIAASYDGHLEDYETALENGKIVLDFTSSFILNGTYKVKNLIAGKEYEIKIFVRAKNMKPAEYLKTKATLPFIDEAEIISVTINGNKAVYDKKDDSFSYYYFIGLEEASYAFTYELMRGCALYINGEKTESKEIKIKPYEPIEVTAVYERTQASRDYIIYVGGKNNGIPIVIINTDNNKRVESQTKEVTAYMKIIDFKDNPMGIGLYNGEIGIRGRGNSSWGMPKKGYNFSTEEKVQIFDMAPSRDWMLMANYTDKSLMRNYTAFEFARDLGMAFAPKMRFVDIIWNGKYIGNYVIGERVKIDKGRLDLPKLKKDMTSDYEITGSFILEINHRWRLKNGEVTFNTNIFSPGHSTVWGPAEGDTVVIRQPGRENLSPEAFEYIKNYFNEAEDALYSSNFKDPEKGYRKYFDIPSFVDWYLINELYKQVDADMRLSTFFYKPRGDDKIYMGPVWDFDLGAGNADYRSCDDPKGWYVRTGLWLVRLFEDEWFEQQFKDRWNYLKENGYFDNLFKRIDETAKYLEKSAEMNFEKWPTLGIYTWPNANNWWDRTTYQSEVDYLKEWLKARFNWMDYEINTVRVNPADETKLAKTKYPNVRFGDTSDILLLEVEWHTPETYSEYIQEIKNMIAELPDDVKKQYKDQHNSQIKWMEENLKLLKRNRYFEPRLINGKKSGAYFTHYDVKEKDIAKFFDKNGYYMFKIYPYYTYVAYYDENGDYQYKSFGSANSNQEYEYVLRQEIQPFCDELLKNGLLTQEDYDYYTKKYPLDIWVERLFN